MMKRRNKDWEWFACRIPVAFHDHPVKPYEVPTLERAQASMTDFVDDWRRLNAWAIDQPGTVNMLRTRLIEATRRMRQAEYEVGTMKVRMQNDQAQVSSSYRGVAVSEVRRWKKAYEDKLAELDQYQHAACEDMSRAWTNLATIRMEAEKLREELCEARAEVERLQEILTGLSSYVGAGLGDDATTNWEERIRWGIDHVAEATEYRARQSEAKVKRYRVALRRCTSVLQEYVTMFHAALTDRDDMARQRDDARDALVDAYRAGTSSAPVGRWVQDSGGAVFVSAAKPCGCSGGPAEHTADCSADGAPERVWCAPYGEGGWRLGWWYLRSEDRPESLIQYTRTDVIDCEKREAVRAALEKAAERVVDLIRGDSDHLSDTGMSLRIGPSTIGGGWAEGGLRRLRADLRAAVLGEEE